MGTCMGDCNGHEWGIKTNEDLSLTTWGYGDYLDGLGTRESCGEL